MSCAPTTLRGTAKNSDFKSDDFPVGKFAELFQQIMLLDGWLQPVSTDKPTVEQLTARCEALGYRLYVTNEGTQLVIDHEAEPAELVFIHESNADDDLEEWIADREQVSARVRQAGQVKLATGDLCRAAEKVIKLYRADGGWDALAGETDRGYKPLPELEEALGKLETALDVATDTAEVLASRADQVANRINRIAAVRDLTADEAREGLHAETVREIRREYPDADERERKLRVAIRESIGMTRYEEDAAYERIRAALQL